ncbi:MAG: transcriptional repressor general negative regulator of transcription subunit 4 [Bathelium mastoideum]|nr:MAG: transcriptional repressor general negative regulator of transcription subunit 4 [Bathelium mastoideum]
MSRAVQDQFIDDDEEETCPLCVEELDLYDRNFRPCPCGYQICQFCFNNIKTTMNGLCPACRRPYDDKTIEWKAVSPEEVANYKADAANKAKKNAAAKQKEAQKREADSLSRKHLAGLRVVQKNLVYVTGLRPSTREDLLLQALRGDDYFGQYGKIIKIVVSKPKGNAQGQESVGVYVTFARKEDAEACIAAVDGIANNGRTLRAQYGTTKYCSTFLRNETCNNRNCMFLHEPGEDSESFTRQDLSAMNVISTQQPTSSHASSSRLSQPHAPPQHAPQPVASATQPMSRAGSREGPQSPSGSNDGPGLPSHANWAQKTSHVQPDRSSSGVPSVSNASPAISHSGPTQIGEAPSVPEAASSPVDEPEEPSPSDQAEGQSPSASQAAPKDDPEFAGILNNLIRSVTNADFSFRFSTANVPEEDLFVIENFPLMIDPRGGEKRRVMRQKQEEQRQRHDLETQIALQAAAATEPEENPESGSLQLGGEPEDQHDMNFNRRHQNVIQPPSQANLESNVFSGGLSGLNLNSRNAPSQHQDYQLLQTLKPGNPQANMLLSSFQSGQTQQNNTFPGLSQHHGGAPGHARQSSKFNFGSDNTTSKTASHGKTMNQQPLVSPAGGSHFSQTQGLGNQLFSTVQGPPPGLKTTGTPPVSGGGMFGQGHGFANNALGFNAGLAGRNSNDDYLNDLMRGGRGRTGTGGPVEAGKRESHFPSFLHQHPQTSTPAPAPGLLSLHYGPQSGPLHDAGPQKPKKKGKKHRHANTSSSGGGGVVDAAADPSILQARLQSGAPVGQGLYGGQGQDQSSLATADDRPSDKDHENSATVPVHVPTHVIPSDILQGLEDSRRSTPAMPPGLPVPANIASDLQRSSSPPHRPLQPITPAVPILPSTNPRTNAPSNLARSAAVDQAEHQSAGKDATDASAGVKQVTDKAHTHAHPTKDQSNKENSKKQDVQASTYKSSASIQKKATEDTSKEAKNAEPERTAAVHDGSKQNIGERKASLPKDAPKVKTGVSEGPSKEPSNKRQPPGKLEIPPISKTYEGVSASQPGLTNIETPEKASQIASATSTSASRPGTPATAMTESPFKKAPVPRTLRVVSTPKAETPPSVSTTAHVLPTGKIPSRQPSIVSMYRSDTPASEIPSEPNSTTSASLSRANSPPPSATATKVGSAPIRTKTKSQLKKERHERAKLQEQESKVIETAQTPAVEEPVAAPLTGRKKKTKKEKQAKTSAGNPTLDDSQPPSSSTDHAGVEKSTEEQNKTPTLDRKDDIVPEVTDEPAPATTQPTQPPVDREVTISGVFADLQSSGFNVRNLLKHFKPISSNNRYDINAADIATRERPISFTEKDHAALAAKEPLHLGGDDGRLWSRTLVTPSQNLLRNLSREEEDRYLELERRVRADGTPTKFVSPRKGSGAASVDALLPSVMNYFVSSSRDAPPPHPAMEGRDGSTDDAMMYFNQMVPPMPPAPGGPAGGDSPDYRATYANITGTRAGSLARYDPVNPPSAQGAAATNPSAGASANAGRSAQFPAVGVKEAESAWLDSKKKTERLERELNALIKRNRKLLTGTTP